MRRRLLREVLRRLPSRLSLSILEVNFSLTARCESLSKDDSRLSSPTTMPKRQWPDSHTTVFSTAKLAVCMLSGLLYVAVDL